MQFDVSTAVDVDDLVCNTSASVQHGGRCSSCASCLLALASVFLCAFLVKRLTLLRPIIFLLLVRFSGLFFMATYIKPNRASRRNPCAGVSPLHVVASVSAIVLIHMLLSALIKSDSATVAVLPPQTMTRSLIAAEEAITLRRQTSPLPCPSAEPCPECETSICPQIECPACPDVLPPPPSAHSSAPQTALEWRYNPVAGFAGGLVEREDLGLFWLPPDYCFVKEPQVMDVPVTNTFFSQLDPQTVTFDSDGACFWAKLAWRPQTGPLAGQPIEMCTHDPSVDRMVSTQLHSGGQWIAEPESSTFASVACTRDRPFMLDIGSNIGAYGIMASALGCQVIYLDPIVENLGRALETVRRIGALENATFLQNAVGIKRGVAVKLGFSPQNPGASSVLQGDTVDKITVARTVVLDELFSWPERPMNPYTRKLVEPSDVNFVKVDVEGFDVVAYYSMQRLLQEGRVPFLTIEFNTRMANEGAGCDSFRFVRHQHTIGYR